MAFLLVALNISLKVGVAFQVNDLHFGKKQLPCILTQERDIAPENLGWWLNTEGFLNTRNIKNGNYVGEAGEEVALILNGNR